LIKPVLESADENVYKIKKERHIGGKKKTIFRMSNVNISSFVDWVSAVQWQLLHVEKDDQVIRHNNNKTWETKEKRIRKASLFKTLVKNCSAEKYLFCFAGSLLCVYYFCTIFVIQPKKLALSTTLQVLSTTRLKILPILTREHYTSL
jgi:hypothetical protein